MFNLIEKDYRPLYLSADILNLYDDLPLLNRHIFLLQKLEFEQLKSAKRQVEYISFVLYFLYHFISVCLN